MYVQENVGSTKEEAECGGEQPPRTHLYPAMCISEGDEPAPFISLAVKPACNGHKGGLSGGLHGGQAPFHLAGGEACLSHL